MESKLEDCFTKWISRIVEAPVTVADITNGKPLIDLANLTGDLCILSKDLTDVRSQEQFNAFLDGSYQFRASGLFCLESVISGSATMEEMYGLCLLVLITCLQSQSKQLFIDAALDLDFETQNFIFHLLHEPMTQLSTDQRLTRESVVSGFHKPMPSPQSLAAQADTLNHTRTVCSSTLGLPEQNELQTTPIRSVPNHPSTRQSWCGSHDMQPHSDNADPFSDPLCHSWTAGLRADPVCSSPIDTNSKKVDQPGGTVFRVPQFVCPRKVKPSESVPVVKPSHATDGVKMVNFTDGRDEPYTTTRSYIDFRYEHHLDTCTPCPSSSSPSMPVHYRTSDVTSSKPCRPTDLSLHVNTATHRYNSQSSLPNSMATSLADLSDYTSGHRQQLHHSLASPLTSVKHLLDSPLWAQKMRLRETERERRRLLGELDKERAYRDEVENVVAELRSQLDEARVRATEAEAKATRMSRDLAALQDQTDELNVCRSELALREDEIASLKQRLNSFQNLLSHSRKLEVENANLHQECADHRQKIEQLSGKLSEIKDRQLVCSEVETLRSKLRDVEAQLAQQLLDSENVQRDARRQQELLNQLKLQQSLTEKRRERNNRQVTIDVYTTNLNDTNDKLASVRSAGNVSEIEFEDPLPTNSQTQQNGPSELVPHKDASKMLSLSQDLPVVRNGENLGSVLETELQSANAHIVRLQNQLSCTLDKLSVSEGVIQDLTERVNHMTTDLSALSVQRELDSENARLVEDQFANFQSDFATLEARLAWSRVCDVNADSNSEAQLKLHAEILDHLRNLGTGLSEPLDNLCRSIADQFESAWRRLVNHQTTLLSSLDRAQTDLKVSNETLSSKASELNQALDKLNAQAEQHKQMKLVQETQIRSLELEKSDLQQQLHDKSIALTRTEDRLHSLETEKLMLERSLSDLKIRADSELNSSKQLLDQATQRLRTRDGNYVVQAKTRPGGYRHTGE
ncbi:RAB6-interacting protein 2 [Paragonimus skrjabini miyazakii]|uniref:RAB6-interacting protein 2 n=1 Tax=Paragonimus skrjabini miyazakii TaxID=59628 RepID=A0A8S9YA43_9TREM|nr:RAB6-interacting protein 2 [Paragonimus skrjabini miyazakii]